MDKEKKRKKRCEVCSRVIDVDIYKQGRCPFCGWWNCVLNEESPDDIAMPNLIPLDKAKQLYNEGKPFDPDFDEFIRALNSYGEMQFEYDGTYYAVEYAYDENNQEKIQLTNLQTNQRWLFENDEDFKQAAKINGEYLKDIWDHTTDRYWLQ